MNKKEGGEEKAQFLEILLKRIQDDHHLIQQVGWDLPKVLIRFINTRNVDLNTRLLYNGVVATSLKCFNEIALHGNAKECFLTGCELLGELELHPSEKVQEEHEEDATEAVEVEAQAIKSTPEEANGPKMNAQTSSRTVVRPLSRDPEELVLEVKLHMLLELINSTLRRIRTCYPSRFLAMAVSSIFSFVRSNSIDIDDTTFVLRRVYTFARNFIPPQSNAEAYKDMSTEEILKVRDDEEALQRKLLRCLLTFSIGQLVRPRVLNIATEYFFRLKNKYTTDFEYEMRVNLKHILSRYYQLAYSFDIDVKEEFLKQCVKDSSAIYQSLPNDSELINDAARNGITQLVYQLSYSYGLQRSINEKNLSLDPAGLLVLATQHYLETGQILDSTIRADCAIYMYLRFVTPEMYNPAMKNTYACDCCNFWLWVAVTKSSCKDSKEALQNIPSYLSLTFLQILLLKSFNETLEHARMVSFTLLTRLLCLMPEETTFEFAKDTLLSCPFIDLKCCMLGILKDLMLNSKIPVSNLATELSELKLSEDEKSHSKPPLPSRPFIMINEDRMATIHSLALLSFEDTIENADKGNLRLSLTYINFFVGLRLKWDKHLLAEVEGAASKIVNSVTKDNSTELGFIEIALDNLKAFLPRFKENQQS